MSHPSRIFRNAEPAVEAAGSRWRYAASGRAPSPTRERGTTLPFPPFSASIPARRPGRAGMSPGPRNRSTSGSSPGRSSRYLRAMQPARTSRRMRPRRFSRASPRISSIDSSFAACTNPHVLSTATSARPPGTRANPLSERRPAITSESTAFFPQPRVWIRTVPAVRPVRVNRPPRVRPAASGTGKGPGEAAGRSRCRSGTGGFPRRGGRRGGSRG